MNIQVQITIVETTGRYIFDDKGDMHFEENPNAGQPVIEKIATVEHGKVGEMQKLLSDLFPTCHVNCVWEWETGQPKNFVAGASKWAMEVEF